MGNQNPAWSESLRPGFCMESGSRSSIDTEKPSVYILVAFGLAHSRIPRWTGVQIVRPYNAVVRQSKFTM